MNPGSGPGNAAVQNSQAGRDNIAVAGDYYAAPTPTVEAPRQLRAPVTDFVGREAEIEQLVQALSQAGQRGAAAISGARGLGGVGKTQLAYVVAQRLLPTYPDAQIVLEMRGSGDNPLTPEQALQTAIHAFEPLAKLPDGLGELQSIYNNLLTGKRALVLADNARDLAQVEPLMPPAGCALLLTSRRRFNLPGMVPLDLGTLPPKEAEQLLREICSRIGSDNAPALAKLCGFLPLALRVSADLLANDDTRSVKSYLKDLENERTRLQHMEDPDAPDDPYRDVEASLQLSYKALDPATQQALCQISVFPAGFDLKAANAVVELPGEDVEGIESDEGTESKQAVAGRTRVEQSLSLLRRFSLVDWDMEGERYSLHDLVRVFAAGRLSDDDTEDARLRHALHYVQVAAVAQVLYLRGSEALLDGLKLFDRERAHIDAGWGWARGQKGSSSPQGNALLLKYASATAYIGDLRYDKRQESIPQLEATVEAARRLGYREAEGVFLGNLGNAYAALGETRKAIEHYEQALAIAREIGDRRGEGNALGNLGNAYADLGETGKAIEHYEQALAIAREIGDRRGEGSDLGNLGLAYEALGETGKAIEHYEQHLAIAREIGNRRDEGSALGNLGNAYAALGETGKAIEHYEQHLAIAREIGNRRGEGSALGNLGNAYAALGETGKAIEHYEQHLAIAREIGDRRGEGSDLGNLGVAYAALGETRKAIEHHGQALTIFREIGDRRGEGAALVNLGLAYQDLGETRKAIEHHEQRLAIAREIGDRHGEGGALGNLGVAYSALGETRKAIEHHEQYLAISREIEDRRGEAITSWNLGLLLEQEGDLARAVELMQVTVDFEREIGHVDAEKDAAGLEQVRKRNKRET